MVPEAADRRGVGSAEPVDPPVVPAAGGTTPPTRRPRSNHRTSPDRAERLMLRACQHRVLLVEDESDIVSPLVQTLEREGYVVDQAATGRDAIAAAIARDHDIVILDLGLPDMDGLEVCRRLRDGGLRRRGPDPHRPHPASSTGWSGSTRAPTTTSPSRSASPSCWPACARCSGVRRSARRPRVGGRPPAPGRRRRPPRVRRRRRGRADRQGVRRADRARRQPRQGRLALAADGGGVERGLVRLDQDPRRHHRPTPAEAGEGRPASSGSSRCAASASGSRVSAGTRRSAQRTIAAGADPEDTRRDVVAAPGAPGESGGRR